MGTFSNQSVKCASGKSNMATFPNIAGYGAGMVYSLESGPKPTHTDRILRHKVEIFKLKSPDYFGIFSDKNSSNMSNMQIRVTPPPEEIQEEIETDPTESPKPQPSQVGSNQVEIEEDINPLDE